MPDDKIEVLDDFVLDMDIETITLDDMDSSHPMDIKNTGLASLETTPDMSMDDIKVETPNEDAFSQEQNSVMEELSIPTDNDFSGNELQLEEINQIEETPEPAMPIDQQEMIFEPSNTGIEEFTPEVNIAASQVPSYNSDDDIISMDGSDLDKIIYYGGGASTPEAKIDDVVVVEEPVMPESGAPIDHAEKLEDLIDTGSFDNMEISVPMPEDTISAEKPETSEFNFDLSVIPDVAEIEEDEPIALSMDELNNIDISEGTVIEFPSAEIPSTPDMESPMSIPEEEEISISESNLEQMAKTEKGKGVSLDELNDIQADITEPGNRDSRSKVIDEKLAALSSESKDELRSVLVYLDSLLEDLPENKIKEFAKSEYYDLYVKILDKLGI
jgi:pilus assembly protein FimV